MNTPKKRKFEYITVICTIATVFLTAYNVWTSYSVYQMSYDIYQIESGYEPRILAVPETIRLIQPDSYEAIYETNFTIQLVIAAPHQGEIVIKNSTFTLNEGNSYVLDEKYRHLTTVKFRDEKRILVSKGLYNSSINIPVFAEIWLDPYYTAKGDAIDLGVLSFTMEYYDIQTKRSWAYVFETSVVWMRLRK